MKQAFKRVSSGYSGWIIIIIIVILIIGAIFAGRFFKSEEKIKLAFRNGQIISFFVASYNEAKIIKGGFVLFFHPKTNRCVIVSMLPKTYISFGNNAYYTLEEALQKKISYEDIKNSISGLLGLKIDYYVFLEKKNLVRLVDMIGGVEIFSQRLKYPSLQVDIPSGITLLDGDKSIEYLSFVIKNESNYKYKHLKRIQNYIRGFLKLKENFFEQYNEHAVANYLYKTINTNMSVNEFLIFYNEIKERDKNKIKDYTKGFKSIILYCDKKNIPGYEYIYLPKKSGEWLKSELLEAIENLEKHYNLKEVGGIVIEILNGTDVSGLAARARNYLSGFGIDILNIGNAENDNYENTAVVIHGNEQKARRLAGLINCKKIIKGEVCENKKIDVILILGRDFDGRLVR